MFYTIYFGDKPVFLCNNIDDALKDYLHHPETVLIDEVSRPALKAMLHEIEKKELHSGILVSNNLEQLKHDFFHLFTIVEAAGGVVGNSHTEVLLIHRRGIWDLPKGKIDQGESVEAAALREVKEETGLRQVTIEKQLLTTYHTYHAFGKFILKPTHWFSMIAQDPENLMPQTEEDITEVRWVKKNELSAYLPFTFASIRDVLKSIPL